MEKLENTDAQLDRRLARLRATIKQKKINITDLEEVLHEDIKRIKSIPIYFWVLFIAHFLFMLESWRKQDGVYFLANLLMVVWLHRKAYREIAMQVAVPVGLIVLFLKLFI